MKENWQTTALLLLLALVLGYLLGQSSLVPRAHAQSEGTTGRVILSVGAPVNGRAPLVLVDTLEQSIVIYDYYYPGRRMELVSARTYRFDKQLLEFQILGPTVETIRRQVERAPR